jgi:hypothetical protein
VLTDRDGQVYVVEVVRLEGTMCAQTPACLGAHLTSAPGWTMAQVIKINGRPQGCPNQRGHAWLALLGVSWSATGS